MGADAVRASRHPNAEAEAAAQLLESGGVLVPDLTTIQDGRVSVVRGTLDEAGLVVPEEHRELPGMFMPGFAGTLVLSPKTAQKLGLDNLVYVGSVLATSRGLYPWEISAARDLLWAESPLAWPASAPPAWGEAGVLAAIGVLVALGVTGTVISVLLARTQQSADLATLHALGAPRRFLRRVVASQAAVIFGLGVPVGLLAGLGLGAFWIAWSRHLAVGGA